MFSIPSLVISLLPHSADSTVSLRKILPLITRYSLVKKISQKELLLLMHKRLNVLWSFILKALSLSKVPPPSLFFLANIYLDLETFCQYSDETFHNFTQIVGPFGEGGK